MAANMYHQDKGAENMWTVTNGEVSQPPKLDLSEHLLQNRNLHCSNPNKLLINLPSTVPQLLFNCQQQKESTNSNNSIAHVCNQFSQEQQQYPITSSLYAKPERVGGNDAFSRWPFPAWAKLKHRDEMILQASQLKPKSPSLGGERQKLKKHHLKESGDSLQPQSIEWHLKVVDHNEDLHNEQSSTKQLELGKNNKQQSLNQSLEFSSSIPSWVNPDSAISSAPCPVLGQNMLNSHFDMTQKTQPCAKKNISSRTKNTSTKKRIRVEEKWIRNVRKQARSKGESYTSVRGKTVPARTVKPVDCSKCKFNCPMRVPEEEQWRLLRHYWSLESYKAKVDYLCSLIHEFLPLRPMSGRRSYSRRYMLKFNGKDERVCKDFFISTFDISQSTIMTFMAKKRKGPNAVADMRGKQKSINKTPDAIVRVVREHILSQTGLQGGVVRHVPGEEVQNVQKLYNHYQAECQSDNTKAASISMYRKILSDIYKDKSQVFMFESPEDCNLHQDSSEKNSGLPVVNTADTHILSDSCSSASFPPPSYEYSTNPCQEQRVCSLPSKPDCLSNFRHSDLLQSAVFNKHFMSNEQSLGKKKSDGFDDFYVFNVESSSETFNSVTHSDFPGNNHLTTHSHQTFFKQPSSQMAATHPSISLPNSSSHIIENPDKSVPEKTNKNLALESFMKKACAEKKGSNDNNIQKEKPRKRSQVSSSKRCRNEESWGRNVRKRLRLKGEAYTSVRGKQVEAKVVKKVDCSKCKFMCTSKISEAQRFILNKHYWSLDTYEKKIFFLTEHVESYTPKRKFTGRKAFSRKYMFEVDKMKIRVCKDFFQSTLHISESTIATALGKTRDGSEVIVDMRGRHRPGNKTSEETLQDIRELIIYLTGLRPHRATYNTGVSFSLRPELCDTTHLYRIYKYDCEKKHKKPASMGIFRGVLTKEFCIKKANLIQNASNDRATCLSQDNSSERTSAATPTFRSENLAESLPATVPKFISM